MCQQSAIVLLSLTLQVNMNTFSIPSLVGGDIVAAFPKLLVNICISVDTSVLCVNEKKSIYLPIRASI